MVMRRWDRAKEGETDRKGAASENGRRRGRGVLGKERRETSHMLRVEVLRGYLCLVGLGLLAAHEGKMD